MTSSYEGLVLVGALAGVLTTIAGQGGGLFLLLACTAFMGPHAALAVTAPALLLGNLHRASMLHRFIDRPVALRMIAGAVPGAFAGGLLAGAMPSWVLRVVLVALTLLSIAKAVGWIRFGVPRALLTVAGLVVGLMTGTAGGAGVLVAPILLSAGLTGSSFVATTSTIAVAMHVGRVVAYGANGLFTIDLLVPIGIVSASIFAGNFLGGRLRTYIGSKTTTRLEYGVLVICVALALGGH